MSQMQVVYAATRNLYSYMLPAVCSLLEHNPDACVWILAEDDDLDFLPEQCKVINVIDQQYFPEGSPNYRNDYSYMVLLRAAYSKIFPDLDRVLSLDIDTIVTEDLSDLWNTDLTGKWFAAVNEWSGQFKPFGLRYYNFGVVLYNLEQIRQDGIETELIRVLNDQEVVYPEQTAWNYYGLIHDKFVGLPTRYNESYCTSFSIMPAIVHFAGVHDWMNRRNIVHVEYLDKYRHLFRG